MKTNESIVCNRNKLVLGKMSKDFLKKMPQKSIIVEDCDSLIM